MKVLMLSNAQLEKEGRLRRCYNTLSSQYDIFIVDTGSTSLRQKSRKRIERSKSNILSFLKFSIGSISSGMKEEFDLIYACNFYSCLPALVIKLLRRKRMIYDAYELYYKEAQRDFSLRDYFFYVFEKTSIKLADIVIAANESRALIMLGRYRLSRMPIVVENIPIYAKRNTEFRSINYNLIRIVYAGYIGEDRGLLELINAVDELRKELNITVSLWGDGPYYETINDYIKKPQYHYVSCRGSYTNDNLSEILSNYDIGYVHYPSDSLNNLFCSPNKVYDYCYNSLPIVASSNQGLEKLVTVNHLGCCNDDLLVAFKDVIKNYDKYCFSIKEFSRINRWQFESEKLSNALNALNGENGSKKNSNTLEKW